MNPFPLEFNPNEFRGRGGPEKRMWFEVLLDSVACYFGQVGNAEERAQLKADAERWIRLEGEALTFTSFDTVCSHLGIPAAQLRHAILNATSAIRLAPAFDRLARPRKSAIVIDLEAVKQMALAGTNVSIIARRFGCSRKAIHRILQPLGLTKRRQTRSGIQSRRVFG